MKQNRRRFLSHSLLVGSGLLLSRSALGGVENLCKGVSRSYGIQLYSLRDILGQDPFGYIKKLQQAGYASIESYEGPMGVYWGKTPKEFATFLNEAGLTMPSIHCNVFDSFDRKVAEAAEAGVKYVICPWIGPQNSIDDFKKTAGQFNEMGAVCKKNGLRFAYHNHDYSFKSLEGKIPQAVLLEYTDPKLVDYVPTAPVQGVPDLVKYDINGKLRTRWTIGAID